MHTGVHLDRTYTGNVLLRTIKAATTANRRSSVNHTQVKKNGRQT